MSRFRPAIAAVAGCALLSLSATAMAADANTPEADAVPSAPSTAAQVSDRWYLDPRVGVAPQAISEQARDTWYLDLGQSALTSDAQPWN